MPSASTAPLGVKLICLLGLVSVFLSLLAGTALLASGTVLGGFAGLLVLGLAFVQAGVLWGLWTVKRWAWTAAVVSYSLGVSLALVELLAGDLDAVVRLLLGAAVVAYVYSTRSVYRREVVPTG
ncbi:hypothetical protein [Salinirubrum litoreum]|uniref:Uncharacterized protein n=1 Tax=Salinirubrum litoreum TaxID=1126234 RepID=A0ABD5RDH4_9EURY|nr:hypothetical protein [Salinirubrum litoreum]